MGRRVSWLTGAAQARPLPAIRRGAKAERKSAEAVSTQRRRRWEGERGIGSPGRWVQAGGDTGEGGVRCCWAGRVERPKRGLAGRLTGRGSRLGRGGVGSWAKLVWAGLVKPGQAGLDWLVGLAQLSIGVS